MELGIAESQVDKSFSQLGVHTKLAMESDLSSFKCLFYMYV